MFKIVFPALLCLAFACPTAVQGQDCCQPEPTCCQADPCQKTRKKLQRVQVQKEVCRIKKVCVTDCCGCTKMKRVKVKECVTRTRLQFVDVPVDPCKKSCFQKLREKMQSKKCNKGCDSGCDPCAAPAPCGCCG